jgi:hypothetical protein
MKQSILVFLLLFLAGCASNSTTAESKYTYTVALDGIVYGYTQEQVSVENIKDKVGIGERIVSPKVIRNGDIGCSVSECKQPNGREFYSIKNTDQEKAIAVKIDEKTYYRCIKIGNL